MSEKDSICNKRPARKRSRAESERKRKRAENLSRLFQVAFCIFTLGMIFCVIMLVVSMQYLERVIPAAPICGVMAMVCKYLEFRFLYEALSE